MINVTSEFKIESIKKRNYFVTADCVLSDGTKLKLKKGDFYNSGNGIVDSSDSSDFPIGIAIEKTATLTLVNDDDRFSGYNFNAARFTLYLTLNLSERSETIKRGTFIVSKKPATAEKISLTLLDHMCLADREYDTNLIFPCTAREMLMDSCQTCGIALGDAEFTNSDYQITQKPENTTHRAVIGAVAALAGGNARIDENDYLRIITFDKEFITESLIYDGGDLKNYNQSDILDGGSMDPWSEEDAVDEGTFEEQKNYHTFLYIKNLKYDTDDVIVTGVKYTEDEQEYMVGADGYVVSLENVLLKGNIEDGLNRIAEQIIGMQMRPFSCNSIANAYATFGDSVEFVDVKGRIYRSYLTNVDFLFNGYTTFSCTTKSAVEIKTEYQNQNQATIDQAKKEAEKKLSAYDIAVQHMNQLAANTMGFHYTQEKQEDGSIISYRHDKPTLEDSNIIYKSGIDGFFLSVDGGETWKAGFDSNGDAVLNILYAIGIQAEWINTRGLTAKDNEGNITFRVDAGTGRVDIIADSFMLRGKTVEELAQSELNDFVSSVFNDTVTNLQAQIDGQIESFYYDYEPLLTNEPASTWETDIDKTKHEGDLFYWKSKGFAYRFMKDGDNWKWQLVQDTDITKAMEQAAKAQDTADGKRRVFTSTPQPPYDAGDLWSTSTENGKASIKICKSGRAAGSFSSDDWIDPKYVDGTDVENAITEYDTSLGQTEVFNKLTNGGSSKGIYIENGELYINASYILAGVLAGKFINAKGIKVLDSSNNITFYIDNSGNVTIRASSFTLEGKTVQSIADSAASDALSSAKSYTDNQLNNFSPEVTLTQQEIFNILTNNGQTQGIYLYNGKIYLNAEYIDADAILANMATIGGWKINSDGLLSSNGTMKLKSDGTIANSGGSSTQFLIYNPSNGLQTHKLTVSYDCALNGMGGSTSINGPTTINDTLTVNYGVSLKSTLGVTGATTFSGSVTANGSVTTNSNLNAKSNLNTYSQVHLMNSSGTDKWYLDPSTDSGTIYDKCILRRTRDTYLESAYSQTTSGGSNLRILSGGILYRYSSSSKRYKNHIRNMELEDIQKLYELPVVWFMYKDGILVESDYRNGKAIPGFYAEDIEEYFPIAADYEEDEDGNLKVESWNEKILMPAMMKMIQEQKQEIDELREEMNDMKEAHRKEMDMLTERIGRLEQMIGG